MLPLHVLRKAREQLLVHYGTKDGFEEELKAVINRSLTVADFETSWKKMLQKYSLEDNNHLKTMYEKREEWVPSFFRGTFFANMSTTQRSEGMHAVLKLLVDNHTSIYRFVLQLEKLVEGIWQKESDEDCRTTSETPQLWSMSNMEVDARRVYTRKIFFMFKKTLKESSNGVVVEVEQERLYEVHITCLPFISNWIPETHRVWINRTDDTISCSCKGYEFVGILCAHAIKVMQHIRMQNLPCKYVAHRWTKDANRNVKRSIHEMCIGPGKTKEVEAMRYATIYPKLVNLRKFISKSGEVFKYVDGKLDEMKAQVMLMTSSNSRVEACNQLHQTIHDVISTQEKSSSDPEYNDPPLSQCKGRKRKPQRLKPKVEKIAPKRRTCSYCNKQSGHIFILALSATKILVRRI